VNAPLRSAVGVLEYWSVGIMGSAISKESKIALLPLLPNIPSFHRSIPPIAKRKVRTLVVASVWNTRFETSDYLDLAANSLDLFPGPSAVAVDLYRERLRDISGAQELDTVPSPFDQPALPQEFFIHQAGRRSKPLQVPDIDFRICLFERIVETPFGQTAL